MVDHSQNTVASFQPEHHHKKRSHVCGDAGKRCHRGVGQGRSLSGITPSGGSTTSTLRWHQPATCAASLTMSCYSHESWRKYLNTLTSASSSQVSNGSLDFRARTTFFFLCPISCLIFLKVPRTRRWRGAKAELSPAVRQLIVCRQGDGLTGNPAVGLGRGAGSGHCHSPARGRQYPTHVQAPSAPLLRALISLEPLPLLQERWQTGCAFVPLCCSGFWRCWAGQGDRLKFGDV